MFETYVIPVIIFALLGILSGALLTIASKVFFVETDERTDRIAEVLPQANCGSCGYAGCADYAKAIVEDGAPTNLCNPGGTDAAEKISDILGTETQDIVPKTAVIHCRGDCDAAPLKYKLSGTQTCAAAKQLYSGVKNCAYGCIGLGDCVRVCESDAIEIINGVAEITGACTACGKCTKVCPSGLIEIKPMDKHIDVKCSSKDNGKKTRLYCQSGCIGCRMCEIKCQHDAIHVIDFRAVLDYNKCTGCGDCAAACPTKAIQNCEAFE